MSDYNNENHVITTQKGGSPQPFYKTVLKEATAEIIEKKSRFIAHVKPVSCEDDALDFLSTIRSKHSSASHNVYAYVCRKDNIQRYSDDGEPAGTAGIPVLEIIKKEGLTDICIVVTRYFGGTLLGAGGLVRAYGKTAKEGIAEAGAVQMIYSDIFTVEIDYSLLGKLQYEVSENQFLTLNSDFGENVTLTICTEALRSDELLKKLTEASFGRAKITKTGTSYVPKSIEL